MPYCGKCGAKIEEGSFCPKCGAKVEEKAGKVIEEGSADKTEYGGMVYALEEKKDNRKIKKIVIAAVVV